MSHSQKQGSTIFIRKSGGSAEKSAHITEKSVPGPSNPTKTAQQSFDQLVASKPTENAGYKLCSLNKKLATSVIEAVPSLPSKSTIHSVASQIQESAGYRLRSAEESLALSIPVSVSDLGGKAQEALKAISVSKGFKDFQDLVEKDVQLAITALKDRQPDLKIKAPFDPILGYSSLSGPPTQVNTDFTAQQIPPGFTAVSQEKNLGLAVKMGASVEVFSEKPVSKQIARRDNPPKTVFSSPLLSDNIPMLTPVKIASDSNSTADFFSLENDSDSISTSVTLPDDI